MKKLQVNMQQLTGSIADGFSMLRQIMNQPNQHPQMSHYVPPALNYSNGFINPAFQISQCNAALQSQTGRNKGVKISSENITEVLIKTCLCVKPEANMDKVLATCFASSTFKVGFSGKCYGRDKRLHVVFSNIQALRWKKCINVIWYTDNLYHHFLGVNVRTLIIDCMQENKQMLMHTAET